MIEMRGVNKWFDDFHVLRNIDLAVAKSEKIVICGPSGSGKSTLVRLINHLETHQAGRIVVDGIELTDNLKSIDAIRREVGIVFQQFNLFPHLTVLENLTLAPVWVRRMRKNEADALAMQLLERVQIAEQAYKYPAQLSGGQQQRVAIARALVNQPKLLVADEPTGSLDSNTGREIMALFTKLNQAGTTIVMVTHEHDIAAFAGRIIRLSDGMIATDEGV